MDDKPISRVNALLNTPLATETRVYSASIALNPPAHLTANKQKYKQAAGNADPNQTSNKFMLLANIIKKSISVLAQALLTQNPIKVLSTHASKASPLATTSFLDDRISRMESYLTKV